MKLGVQRRSIYLTPIRGAEHDWLQEICNREEIWKSFGFPTAGGPRMKAWLDNGRTVLPIIKRVADRERIGFAIAFPPHEQVRMWELAYAIPEPEHRNAFNAICAADAMQFYMFEVMKLDEVAWRTREDNVVAAAVLARIGYAPAGVRNMHGIDYVWHVIDRDAWQRRRAKLEGNEVKYPSPAGVAFATLEEPFDPIL